jgi:hypothetical protein
LKAVHDQLERDFGQPLAGDIEKLLIGFSAKELAQAQEATFKILVDKLKAPDVCIRELALDNLRSLTGRDDLEYDPDRVKGAGLDAWQRLLERHELRPTAAFTKGVK